jgi:hypothetical protein
MAAVNIEPQEETQERTLGGTIALRIAATILGAFIGFSFFVGANLGLSILDQQGPEEDYIVGRFTLSILIWTFIGLVTPFRRIRRFFEILLELLASSDSGKAISYGRLFIAVIILGVVMLIYWYALGILASIINSIFG